ncbi:RNA polymerase subunit sigma [Virgibacillus pantothenticus]|nr:MULTISPECIES: RNA polymerase sigma factor [Virgibacillus]MBS7427020.1 RNA polymerase sigma factor [Virgibacillus sp. 19R1-5]MBU8567721.1 RNA polymerase sigma factor [Virgibacillus pantothenticus]MBU8602108.1 RNA polymerase sigma factor [Virgibacillus pantothenticus]MBU8635745.1 RNA polymerase sigma factor [Virgibacillus pantothenticus]MBU8643955.1 RNA polymerase sigma factor [Virgibacillus pantothenticus]
MQDEEYMRQLSLGIDSAFDILVFRYHKPLFGYVYRLLNDEKLAEDIVQETFLKIYQQGQKGFIPDQFKPWMYKIATNTCKDYWRKPVSRLEYVTDKDLKAKEQVYQIIDHQLERQWMVESLNKLSMDYRTVLYLRFYQDLKYTEIALALDISINTVKTRIARGLKQLGNILAEDERKGVEENK